MLTNTGLLQCLNLLFGVGAGWNSGGSGNGPYLALYTNSPTWSPTTLITDLVFPTNTGYAPQATNFLASMLTIGGTGQSLAAFVTYYNTDTTPLVATGFAWINFGQTLLYGGAPFATPLTIPPFIGSATLQPEWDDDQF